MTSLYQWLFQDPFPWIQMPVSVWFPHSSTLNKWKLGRITLAWLEHLTLVRMEAKLPLLDHSNILSIKRYFTNIMWSRVSLFLDILTVIHPLCHISAHGHTVHMCNARYCRAIPIPWGQVKYLYSTNIYVKPYTCMPANEFIKSIIFLLNLSVTWSVSTKHFDSAD